MKWGIKTNSTPFGKEEPYVKPFGIPNNSHSQRKTSSPLASPRCGESIKLKMKGGSKNE